MSKKSETINKILKEYAVENQVPVRSTSDLSMLEAWLLTKLLDVYKDVKILADELQMNRMVIMSMEQDNDKD